LCEKPFAAAVDEARRRIDAANANGVLLTEGISPRFLPYHRLVLDTIDAGAIGEIRPSAQIWCCPSGIGIWNPRDRVALGKVSGDL